jgi:hypothetical protein
MRTKFFALASATALGVLALTGVQSTAQAEEGYRHQSFRVEHRDRDNDRGRQIQFRQDRDREHNGDRR